MENIYGITYDEKSIKDDVTMSVKEQKQKRGCCSRWFGPLSPGSMRGSIFALM